MKPKKGDERLLEDILAAREERAARQKVLLAGHDATLICFTLNIAGPRKTFPLAEQTFREGRRQIFRELKRAGMAAKYEETLDDAGYAGYWAVEAEAEWVKRMMVAIEKGSPLGRLYDIDVLRQDGRKISRQELGLPARTCLICGRPAVECSRSRGHPLEEVERRTQRIMRDYFREQCAERIAQAAARAMLYEVSVTPKPGLVDREGTGAHRDMDIFTFLDSAVSLAPWFRSLAEKGLEFRGSPEELFRASRYLGLQAEDAMYRATGGVNTHKGLIFSFGLLCAAAGYLHGNGLAEDAGSVLDLCSRMAAEAYGELEARPSPEGRTHGERAYAKYGLSGVRGEAARGFPEVAESALPLLRSLTGRGLSCNDAGAVVLLHLISCVDDTNAVSRSNLETFREVQEEVRRILAESSDTAELLEAARRLDARFISLNISPGGCADLLAVSFFLFFLFPESP